MRIRVGRELGISGKLYPRARLAAAGSLSGFLGEQQMPGFLVAGELASAFGRELEGEASVQGGYGDDVPAVFSAEVDGQEVDFRFPVGYDAAVEMAAGIDVVATVPGQRAAELDLDSPDPASAVDHEVVAGVVAVGAAHDQVEPHADEPETDFGQVAEVLGVIVVGAIKLGPF